MRKLNKNNILTTTVSINRTLQKQRWENSFKNMGTKCTQFRSSRKFFCSVIQGLTTDRPSIIRLCGIVCASSPKTFRTIPVVNKCKYCFSKAQLTCRL
jgi:hypothetical protein